jgi:hypothetical protein
MLSPVVLFAFNRPEHLRRTLQALAANELAAESDLTVFCDGPRHEEEKHLTDAVQKIARGASGFRSCEVIGRENNLGLAGNIINGVTQSLEKCGRIIVLEDDLITSPYFLRYMNDALDLYADNPKVASIHGWCFPHGLSDSSGTFFLRGADCWGWATWRRAWRHFNPDALALLGEIKRRGDTRAFNRGNNYDYTGMLEAAASGEVSSWAICWLASTWLRDMYTLYPCQSLVFHNGSDGSGTHCSDDSLHDVPLAGEPIPVYPVAIREDPVMAGELEAFLRTLSGGAWALRTQRIKKHFPAVYTAYRALKRTIRTIY